LLCEYCTRPVEDDDCFSDGAEEACARLDVNWRVKRLQTQAKRIRHTHTHPFNGPFSGTTRVSRYQKGKTNLDFTNAGDSEWQWHQLGHMQICTPLQTDNDASTPPLSFYRPDAGCPSCRPTNSVKALKAESDTHTVAVTKFCSEKLKLYRVTSRKT